MRPVSAFWRRFQTTVQIAPRTGVDGYAKATYSTAPTPYQAHLSGDRRLVRTAAGLEALSNQKITLMTTDLIDPSAQITLSTADVGSTEEAYIHPLVLCADPVSDAGGRHHTVLRLSVGRAAI